VIKRLARATLKSILPRSAYCRVRRAYDDHRRTNFPTKCVRHNYGGFDLEILLADSLGQGWYDADWGELPEIAILRRHGLGSGSRVFDLGAHQCVVALMLARIVGPDGLVVAIEPEPANVAIAERNKELNGAENLTIIQGVGTERNGPLPLGAPPKEGVDYRFEWRMLGVEGITVDQLSASYGRPDVLFIDVEGFECEVLRGARETLQARPDCFVEVHVGVGLEKEGGSVTDVLSHFPSDSYELLMASEEQRGFVPFSRTSPLLSSRFFLLALNRNALKAEHP
jgi:FkbM family methyltransferase